MLERLLVGLTGGIGAGKTALASLLARRGARVIAADDEGHTILKTDAAVVKELAAAFGPAILTADGAIDRAALARIAFASAENTARLNAIVHPPLWKKLRAAIAAETHKNIVVIDAALIVEWQQNFPVDIIVFVDTPLRLRKGRSRVKYSDRDFYARQNAQAAIAVKRAAADIIVVNTGTAEELAAKADRLYAVLQDIAGGTPLSESPLIL